MSKTTKLYPIRARFLHSEPAVVHVVDKAEAEDLIATGAFTDDASHPDRDHDAPDLTAEPAEIESEPESETPDAA